MTDKDVLLLLEDVRGKIHNLDGKLELSEVASREASIQQKRDDYRQKQATNGGDK